MPETDQQEPRPSYLPPANDTDAYVKSLDLGGPPPDPVDQMIARRGQITEDAAAKTESLDAQRMAIASQPTPHPPQPHYQNIPQAPQTDYRSVFKDSSPGLIFATVMGSMLSRQKGMGAMAAATGYMEGFHKGDKEVIERERQKWEDSVSALVKQNQVETERYNAIWNDTKLTMADKQARIQAIASSIGDQQTAAGIRTGQIDQTYKMHQDRYNSLEKSREFTLRMDEIRAKREETQLHNRQLEDIRAREAGVKEGQLGVAQAREQRLSAVNEGKGQLSPEDKTYYAKMYNLVGNDALRGFGYGQSSSAARKEILSEARALATAEGKGPGDVVERRADVKASQTTLTKLTQQQSAIRQFENTARKNGDVLLQLAQKVDKTGIQIMERWLRAARQATGDPDVAAFHAQMQLYRAEVARIITNPNLTGVLTDTARKEAEGFISGASSLQQLRAVTTLLNGDFDRRAGSLTQEIEAVRATIGGREQKDQSPAAPSTDTGGWR